MPPPIRTLTEEDGRLVAALLNITEDEVWSDYDDYEILGMVQQEEAFMAWQDSLHQDYDPFDRADLEVGVGGISRYPGTPMTSRDSGEVAGGESFWSLSSMKSLLKDVASDLLSPMYGVEDVFDTGRGDEHNPYRDHGRSTMFNIETNIGREKPLGEGLGGSSGNLAVEAAKYIADNPMLTHGDRIVQGTGEGTFFDHNYEERNFRSTYLGDYMDFESSDIKGSEHSDWIVQSAYSSIGTDTSRPAQKDLWPGGIRYDNVCADTACDAFTKASLPWPKGANGVYSSDIDFSIEAFQGGKCKSGTCGGDLNPGLSEQYEEITDPSLVAPGDVAFISGRGHTVLVTQVYKDGVVEVVHTGGEMYPVHTKTYDKESWKFLFGGDVRSGIAFRFKGNLE